MNLTPAQRKAIVQELDAWGEVALICDDYNVLLRTVHIKPRRGAIIAYINGKHLGKWLIEDCEERRRFFRETSRYLHSTQTRRLMRKALGGAQCSKENLARINERFVSYSGFWFSAPALLRHILRHNRSVELVNVGWDS